MDLALSIAIHENADEWVLMSAHTNLIPRNNEGFQKWDSGRKHHAAGLRDCTNKGIKGQQPRR